MLIYVDVLSLSDEHHSIIESAKNTKQKTVKNWHLDAMVHNYFCVSYVQSMSDSGFGIYELHFNCWFSFVLR